MNWQTRRLPAPPNAPEESNYYPAAAAMEEAAVPLTHYLWVLRRHRWRIIGGVFAVVTAVLLYTLQLTPQYESVALVEIENQVQMFEVGTPAFRVDFRNFESVMNTQLELMDSSGIAQQVIRQLQLDRHPDFNPALRKQPAGGAATPPAEGARAAFSASLPGLSVRRRPDTYLLEVRYRSPNPELGAAIANKAAEAFVQQGFMTRYQNAAELAKWLNKQLEELQARLERSQAAMRAYEKQHQVVNPEDRSNLMNLQLQQLQDELTKVHAERLRKESAYRSVETGNLESLSISAQGEPLMRLQERLEGLEANLAEAGAQYGPNHPNYKRIEVQISQVRGLLESNKQKVLRRLQADYEQAQARERALAAAVAEHKGEVDRLGARAVEYGVHKREVESLTKLHDELLKKINEASINSSIKATNLRLANLATPPREPVFPNVRLYMALALLLSTTLAIGVALGADYLDRTLRSSEQVEQWLNLPVLATLPRLAGKKTPALLASPSGAESETKALARSRLPFTEALSILRTSLLLSENGQEVRTLLVASAAPAEGKTTVATGLALALAQQVQNGDRVLLVDSDLRRPNVHNVFGLPNRVGLSTVLEGSNGISECILPSGGAAPNLMVLPAGPAPRYSSELLTTHMAKVMAQVRQEYRYVVVDSAPLLVCADTTILSTMADAVIVVARAGETPRDAVATALRQLRRVRANVVGVVLNQVLQSSGNYGGYNGGGYYSYAGYYYHRADEA